MGYEISPQVFELCSKKSKQNLTLKLANLLEDDADYFDIVMAIDVFEHIKDYFGFLRKLNTKFFIFHLIYLFKQFFALLQLLSIENLSDIFIILQKKLH
ncbi:hypothetical protein SAMN05216333_1479 [Nitrosomonas oligotropha]|uniref:Methyltransferase domain-containing protein n=1 Tax=Nitrosomonas oligotropha TaxID=42354 RepID=A0A1H8V734_9PROT|nr:hypothetical protein SAMN05216333_1479 [Nitrosomonas oligotropha]